MKFGAVAVWVFAWGSAAFAQVDPGGVRQRKPNQCLSDADLQTNKELKALNRPTAKADHNWVFDPDYLLGKWTFEWDVPETPISAGGKTTGSYTFKRIEDCFYEGAGESTSAEGPSQAKVLIVYSPELKHLTWLETDSRGFSMLRTGKVAGDLGGYFTFHWEAPAFTFKGKVLYGCRARRSSRLRRVSGIVRAFDRRRRIHQLWQSLVHTGGRRAIVTATLTGPRSMTLPGRVLSTISIIACGFSAVDLRAQRGAAAPATPATAAMTVSAVVGCVAAEGPNWVLTNASEPILVPAADGKTTTGSGVTVNRAKEEPPGEESTG